MDYTDLDVHLYADGDGFRAAATLGEQTATEPFELDLTRSWDLWELQEQGREEAKRRGSELFTTLLCGTVRDLYQQGRGSLRGRREQGLRVRIVLDPRDPRVRALLRLPWEIAFDPLADGAGFLALDPRRPVVRALACGEPALPPVSGKLGRVLLASSDPCSQARLDLDRECAAVREALSRIPVRCDLCSNATRDRLLRQIVDGGHQIVHFMGHGDFDPRRAEGTLTLEGENGGEDLLEAEVFAGAFTGRLLPRLVILSACRSADPGPALSAGPFVGVAAALAAAGLPAVIAMQTDVYDDTAIRFSERLYQRVAAGDPIEAAVSEGRRVIQSHRPESLEWATPVLFVRGSAVPSVLTGEPANPQPLPPSPVPTGNVTTVNVHAKRVGMVIGHAGEVHNHGQGKE